MFRRAFQVGDPVIYRKTKYSTCPGPRAEDVAPAPHGDDYSYLVDKFWVIVQVRDDNKVVARTRRGKYHVLDADTPNLRRANVWERLWYKKRFPDLAEAFADLHVSTGATAH